METAARFYLCACCRAQVLICRRCDRGQIYCSPSCSIPARQRSVRDSGRRYQASRAGRFKHAERSRRYRQRQQNVTHQGSMPPAQDDLLASNPEGVVASPVPLTTALGYCHFCGVRCPDFVRRGFLHSRRVLPPVQPDRRGAQSGHIP